MPDFVDPPFYASRDEAEAALEAARALPEGEDREHAVAVAEAALAPFDAALPGSSEANDKIADMLRSA